VFGLKGGVNIASYSYKESEILADMKPRTGFHVTGYLDTRIGRGVYLNPEVSLQSKGGRIVETSLYGGAEIIQKTMWLDFAFNFIGKIPVNNVGKFFAGAGPYAGFSMNGENTYADGTTTAIIIYKDNAMKNVEGGVNFIAGFKYGSRLSLNASYRLGLTNIVNDSYRWSDNVKNRVLSLALGVSL
jgi:hypothetical protein